MDIVAIDPTKGNVSLLYKLPCLYGLNSNIWVCLRFDSKCYNLIHILVNDADLTVEQSFLYELSITDGRLLNTYNISRNRFELSELYTQWDFDSDTKILYGLCLNATNTTIHWNYTWCSVKFDENGLGKTQHGFFASVNGDPPGPGPCDRLSIAKYKYFLYWRILV